MNLLSATLPDSFKLVLCGDTHEGNVAQYGKGIDQLIEWIGDSGAYFAFLGDEADCVCSDDKRYKHSASKDPFPIRQANAVVERWKPISRRGLVWLNGNHNEKLARFGNLTKDVVCRGLGIPYGTWTCKLRINARDGRQMFKMYLTHGFRGSITSNAKDWEQRMANMKAALKMRLVHKAGDCLVMAMGHLHKLLLVEPAKRLILSDDGGKIRQLYLASGDGTHPYIEPDRRWYCCTGSFLRTFVEGDDSYSEIAGYDPVELGYILLSVANRKIVSIEPVTVG